MTLHAWREPILSLGTPDLSTILKLFQRYVMAKNRALSRSHVESQFGRGGMLGPFDAVAAKMADGVATIEDVMIGRTAAGSRLAAGSRTPKLTAARRRLAAYSGTPRRDRLERQLRMAAGL